MEWTAGAVGGDDVANDALLIDVQRAAGQQGEGQQGDGQQGEPRQGEGRRGGPAGSAVGDAALS